MPTLFSSTDFKNELICAAYNAKINNLAQLLPISANRKNVLINNLTKHYKKIMETNKYPYPEDIEIEMLQELGSLEKHQFMIRMIINNELLERSVYCDTYEAAKKMIINDAFNGNFMTFCPTYIYGFVSEIMKTSYYHQEIEYSRPDESLYDSDSCPCCREKFGVTEYCEEIKPEFIAPRSNKKRMKKWTVVKDKRHTYCGHPLCLECFNTICRRDKPSCPQCRRSYEETGDIRITQWEETIDENYIVRLINEERNDLLLKISNVEAVVKQTLIFVESYAIELGCNDYANFDNNGVWFGCFEPSWR